MALSPVRLFRKTQGPVRDESLVVDLDGAAKGIQKIRKRGLHPVPVGNHRVSERIIKILTCCAADTAHKRADRQFFPVAIVVQPINLSVGTVEAHGVLRLSHVCAEQRVENPTIQLYANSSQSEKEAFHDIHSHLVETLRGVARREFLVLVVVAFRDIHLANAFRRGYAEDLREYAYLNTPV
jgi:hypothetical protein